MRITKPNTQKTLEVDLEPELLDRISEINITSTDITISFQENTYSNPETDISKFKKVINFIKKVMNFIKDWKWIIGSTVSVFGMSLSTPIISESLKHFIVFVLIVITTFIICIKIAWNK